MIQGLVNKIVTMVAFVVPVSAIVVYGQGQDVENRPIKAVNVQGLKEVPERFIRNQIGTKAGDALSAAQVNKDIQNITRLGRFSSVRAKVAANDDGSVTLTYLVVEHRLLVDVQLVGNKYFSDQELRAAILLQPGDPQDEFLINQARDRIKKMYQDEGFYLADVTFNEEMRKQLREDGILTLQVREGPRIRVQEIKFEGNKVFTDNQLFAQIKTRKYIIIFQKGVLSKEILDQDKARLRRFYLDRGYLDVRVGTPRIELSDNQKDAAVTFYIDEGRQYTVRTMKFVGNEVASEAQLRGVIPLKVGDVFSFKLLRESGQAVRDWYAKEGRIGSYDEQGILGVPVIIQRIFHETEPLVDLVVTIEEKEVSTAGMIRIKGNPQTKKEVILRVLKDTLSPGRPIDGTAIGKAEKDIRRLPQFRDVKITVLDNLEGTTRDILVDVKEGQTGSITFGAAVSSDSGIFGSIDVTQRNFDVQDTPESWSELWSGQAFKGAGQYFQIALQPGDEFQRYQISFREPYLFDTNYFLDAQLFFFTRVREDWDEERIGGQLGLGRRFGDVWSANVRLRIEQVDISDIEVDGPVDAFAVRGSNDVDSIGLFLTRSTVKVDDFLIPYKGTRLQVGLEQVGALTDDFDFTRVTASFTAYMTIDEDFFGRKTTLKFRMQVGYILQEDEAPLFERFYAGGHRTFRGYDFRGAGPRGIIAGGPNAGMKGDDPVGGDFMFLMGVEYNFPVFDNYLRAVVFVDTGTVEDDFGFSSYRVSIGTGIRLTIPALGPTPFAFDIAVPIVKEDGDEERVFSFDISLPF